MAKKINSFSGIVFSTDPEFKQVEDAAEEQQTPEPAQQKLRICMQTKHRAGKAVTLVQNFIGKDDDLQELGKRLKAFCGTGGAVKDGEIIVQGDNREKMLQWLLKNGYKLSKKM